MAHFQKQFEEGVGGDEKGMQRKWEVKDILQIPAIIENNSKFPREDCNISNK